ncbi:hypothetical protein F5Y13DRAFT_187109 [Hypoxylon sp. FL1857]|nr:hypothetical protein F5Y13DRAFT_187109 [Hypoxylon sp. FL1857]
MQTDEITCGSKGPVAEMSIDETQHPASERSVSEAPSDTDVSLYDEGDFESFMDNYSHLDILKTGTMDFFSSALELSSTASCDERANHFIERVSKAVVTELSKEDRGRFPKEFEEALMYIASAFPRRSSEQDVLVKAIALLQGAKETDEAQEWKNLRTLGSSMEDAFLLYPTLNLNHGQPKLFTDFGWVNFNSFCARRYGSYDDDLGIDALRELRSGLEIPIDSDPKGGPIADTRIRVAIVWIAESAPRLLRESCLSTYSGNHECLTGPLTVSKGGFNLERWSFWKRRFGEIRDEVKDIVDDDLRLMTDVAIEHMTRAEKELGSMVKPIVNGVAI